MKRPGLRALAVWLLCFGLASAYLWQRLHIQTDVSSLLPQGTSSTQRLLLDQLRAGSTMRLILLGIEGGTPDQLADASRFIKTWMKNSAQYTWIANGDDAWTEHERELVFQHRYVLNGSTETTAFSVESLRSSLQQRLMELSSPVGMMTKSLLGSDPTGEFLSLIQAWQPSGGPDKYKGVWLAQGQDKALVMAETVAPGYAFAPQQQLQSQLRAAFDSYRKQKALSTLQLVLSGPAVFTVKIQERIEADAWQLSVFASLLVIIFLFLTYRSVPVLGLSLIPLVSAIVGGLCTVNLTFGFVHGITLAFGITLLGVVDDYPIHLFSHMDGRHSPHEVMREIWPPMRLGIFTTAIGFAVLLYAPFPGLQHLGMFAVGGLMTAAIVTRFLLPHLVPERFASRPVGTIGANLAIALRRYRPLVALAVLSSGVVLVISRDTLWEHDVDRLTPLSATDKAQDQALRTAIGAPDVRYLFAASGTDVESALEVSERLGIELDRLVKNRELSGYDSAHRYLPSHHLQKLRQDALPAHDALKHALTTAGADLPFKADIFAAFLHDVEQAKHQTPLKREDYRDTMFGTRLAALLVPDETHWIALLPLRGVRDSDKLRKHIADFCPTSCIFLDLKEESNAMVTGFRNNALLLLSYGAITIICILSLVLRDSILVARVMSTMFGAIICSAAVLCLLGEQLSLFHIAAFLLVIGLGLDYALFFNHQHGTDNDRNRTSYGLLVCSTTTILVFGILAFSELPALRSIGLTAALGSAFSLVFSAMLARPGVQPLDV